MNAIAAGVAGALISGVAIYTLGAKTAPVDAFTQEPALVHTLDGQVVPASYTNSLRPIAAPSTPSVTPVRNTRPTTAAPTPSAAQQPVYRPAVQEREVVADEQQVAAENDRAAEDENRTWGKTAMIIGGSAAGGAGVGGIVGGKKGALIGAAIGGGAASIYEATQRR
jgi:hypothetical protein